MVYASPQRIILQCNWRKAVADTKIYFSGTVDEVLDGQQVLDLDAVL